MNKILYFITSALIIITGVIHIAGGLSFHLPFDGAEQLNELVNNYYFEMLGVRRNTQDFWIGFGWIFSITLILWGVGDILIQNEMNAYQMLRKKKLLLDIVFLSTLGLICLIYMVPPPAAFLFVAVLLKASLLYQSGKAR